MLALYADAVKKNLTGVAILIVDYLAIIDSVAIFDGAAVVDNSPDGLFLHRVGHGDRFLRPETLLFRSIGNATEEREQGCPATDFKRPNGNRP